MSRDHDDSGPPPSPIPPAESTGRFAAMPSNPDAPTLEETYRLAKYTARLVGRPPNSLAGEGTQPGTLWHAIATMQTQLGKLEETAEKILERLNATDARRGWLSTRGEKLLDALLVALFLAILAVLLARLGLPSKSGHSGGAYQDAGLVA
jgi:hypothetical protein